MPFEFGSNIENIYSLIHSFLYSEMQIEQQFSLLSVKKVKRDVVGTLRTNSQWRPGTKLLQSTPIPYSCSAALKTLTRSELYFELCNTIY